MIERAILRSAPQAAAIPVIDSLIEERGLRVNDTDSTTSLNICIRSL
jgi:hypothetical protein